MGVSRISDGYYHPELYAGNDGYHHGRKKADSSKPSPGNASEFSKEVPDGPLSNEEGDKLALEVMDALKRDFDLTDEQAAGIVGNLYWESSDPNKPGLSGMNPHINEVAHVPEDQIYGKPADNEFGYGWAQWSGSRKKDFLEFARQHDLDPGSPAANYAFLKHELENGERGQNAQGETDPIKAVKQENTAEEASNAFRKVYERAEDPKDEKRIAQAERLLKLYQENH